MAEWQYFYISPEQDAAPLSTIPPAPEKKHTQAQLFPSVVYVCLQKTEELTEHNQSEPYPTQSRVFGLCFRSLCYFALKTVGKWIMKDDAKVARYLRVVARGIPLGIVPPSPRKRTDIECDYR